MDNTKQRLFEFAKEQLPQHKEAFSDDPEFAERNGYPYKKALMGANDELMMETMEHGADLSNIDDLELEFKEWLSSQSE